TSSAILAQHALVERLIYRPSVKADQPASLLTVRMIHHCCNALLGIIVATTRRISDAVSENASSYYQHRVRHHHLVKKGWTALTRHAQIAVSDSVTTDPRVVERSRVSKIPH